MNRTLLIAGEPALGAWYGEAEIDAAVAAIRRSMEVDVGFRAHEEVGAFEDAFARFVGTRHGIAVNGAGTALDMVFRALAFEPGDEVISCATNFHGSHLAVLGAGARLVLCEPDPSTLNLDPADVARRITPRTRAVLVTHMNGLSADMAALEEVIRDRRHARGGPILLVGDAARACGAMYRGARVGTRGWATVFSFQSKKLMTTLGEGGMIVTDDDDLATSLRQMRSFGEGVEWGTNYKMTKPQAAVGLVQLRRLDDMNARRRALALRRHELLGGHGLRLPLEPPGCRHAYLLYAVVLPEGCTATTRDAIIARLRDVHGVGAVVANPPTYVTNTFVRRRTAGQRMPIAESIGDRLFAPALHPLMTDEDNEFVCAAVLETLCDRVW